MAYRSALFVYRPQDHDCAAVFALVCLTIGDVGLERWFISLSAFVPKVGAVEDIARLAGHSSTRTTETVYRHQLRPVISGGAEAFDTILKLPDS